jgi:argininosuccinate lyase
MTGTVATLQFRTEVMAASAPEGFALATEIADWLVRRGVPFREAHEASGRCVRAAEEAGVDLPELSAEQLVTAHPLLTVQVREVLDVQTAIAARSTPGGTAPVRVREQLQQAADRIEADRAWCAANPLDPVVRG